MTAPRLRSWKHFRLWKVRERNSPSAVRQLGDTDKRIELACLCDVHEWPKKSEWKDPLLRAVFVMRTNWAFGVIIREHGSIVSFTVYDDEKQALAAYRKECRNFPRSKEVDYGFPFLPDEVTE